jgi:hypothetical protein
LTSAAESRQPPAEYNAVVCGGIYTIKVGNVAIVVIVAVVIDRFLSHLQHLAAVAL